MEIADYSGGACRARRSARGAVALDLMWRVRARRRLRHIAGSPLCCSNK
jgi:hypothetical protein